MISIVTWLWQEGFRDYCHAHVNSLAENFADKLKVPHRFVCVAESGEGFSQRVEWFPMPSAAAALAAMRTPEGQRFPSCYRRLWMFSEEARALGERVLLVDLDLVLTRSPAHLLDYREDFIGWRPRMFWGNAKRIGGGLYLLRTGTRRHVWEQFKGAESIERARALRFRGSDQAWMSYCLSDEPVWPHTAGVYSIRDLRNGSLPLPADACLVQFNGPQKPWNSALPWVKDHWH